MSCPIRYAWSARCYESVGYPDVASGPDPYVSRRASSIPSRPDPRARLCPENLAEDILFAMSTRCHFPSAPLCVQRTMQTRKFSTSWRPSFGFRVTLIQRPVLSLYSISPRRLPALLFMTELKLPDKNGNLLELRVQAKQQKESWLPGAFQRAFHPERHDSASNRAIQSITGMGLKPRDATQPMSDAIQKPPRIRCPLLSRSHIGSELARNRLEISAYAWPARSARLQYCRKRVIFKS